MGNCNRAMFTFQQPHDTCEETPLLWKLEEPSVGDIARTISLACWPVSSVSWLCIMALFSLRFLTTQFKSSESLAPDTWKLREPSIHCLGKCFSSFVWREATQKYLEESEDNKDPNAGKKSTLSLSCIKCFFTLLGTIVMYLMDRQIMKNFVMQRYAPGLA